MKSRELLREIIAGKSEAMLTNKVMRYNLIAVRSRGFGKSSRKTKLIASMGIAALANALSRKSLRLFFTRTLFSAPGEPAPFYDMNDLPTERVALSKNNLEDAVLASGSIPLIMDGIENIAGAPHGVYRDGGVTDYHFDTRFADNRQLVLYPHFYDHRIPGWFDKNLKWRRPSAENSENLVLVSPTREFVAKLPYRKIPDRNDFAQLSYQERVKYWKEVIQQSRRLGDAFIEATYSGRIRQLVQPL